MNCAGLAAEQPWGAFGLLEMSQIRYVLPAARHLNLTKAAEDCNVTRPALTKGIKVLEDQLGAQIFHREGRRVLLGDFGRSMLPRLQQILHEADAAKLLARNFRLLDRQPVRPGVLSTIGHIRLARFLARFEKSHAGAELSVSEAPATELQERLEADQIGRGRRLATLHRSDCPSSPRHPRLECSRALRCSMTGTSGL